MKKEYMLNNIINYVVAINEQKTKSKGLCLLLGAGADITSGGKTFRNLKIDFLNSNGYDVPSDIEEQKLTECFDLCVEKFTELGRCIELESIMRKHSAPSEGYELLVFLAELGYIDAVITTNFDLLLEESQKQLSMRPFDIFAPGVAVPNDFYKKRQSHNPIYMKLHGDLYGRYVSHLTKKEIETKEYGEEYIHMLTYILQNYAIISVGYGGYDELIVDIFNNNVNDLSLVYWCDVKEPNPSAPLVKLLEKHNKLYFVKCSFDVLLCELAGNLLKNRDLPDTNPHFIPSIVSAKIKEQNRIYRHKDSNKSEILRDNLIKKLEDFLTCDEKNIIFVHGKRGMGKTTLMRQVIKYYKELFFIPICTNVQDSKSIVESCAKALGYLTDVPFALLFNFSKWCQRNNMPVIFIIDEVDALKSQDIAIKYIKEVCDYLTIVKEHISVKVIVCTDTESYNAINIALLNTFYYQQTCNSIEVSKFSLDELQNTIPQNMNEEFYELIREPYIWNMVVDDVSGLEHSLDKCVEQYIQNNVKEHNFHFINQNNLSIYLEKIARTTLGDAKNNIVNEYVIKFLNEIGIVNEKGVFIYEIFAEYYYYRYLKRLDINKYDSILRTYDSTISNKLYRAAYARTLSDINCAEDIKTTLVFLSDLLEKKHTEYTVILIFETLHRIQKQRIEYLESYMINANLQGSKVLKLLDFVWYTSTFAYKDPFKILNTSYKYQVNTFDAFIIKHEYLKSCLNNSIIQNNINCYIEQVNERISSQDTVINLCDLLFVLTEWGPDNLSGLNYTLLINEFRHIFEKYTEEFNDEEAFEKVAEKVKKYSYNILFNSGPDVEEKFNQAINDLQLRELSKKVIYGEALDETDYLNMLQKTNDIDNAWTFLICNFITVLSMQNDFSSTYKMLEQIPDKFMKTDLVKQIDFYLSSVFMSLYVSENNVFENFNIVFNKVVELYEINLFELPQTRMATLHRFSDEFEMAFEDGFNPLAFYFYVSPSKCYIGNRAWNNGKEYLELYWSLVDKLKASGNYKGILRIVHALGQMISIYPKEGFEALENIPVHSHDIIKKGVLRILKENYLRYPNETNEFLKNSKINFSVEDILQIKSNRDSRWNNRTFEQLHWTRIFVNLTKIRERNIAKLFLDKMFTNQSYKKFFISFLKDIF